MSLQSPEMLLGGSSTYLTILPAALIYWYFSLHLTGLYATPRAKTQWMILRIVILAVFYAVAQNWVLAYLNWFHLDASITWYFPLITGGLLITGRLITRVFIGESRRLGLDADRVLLVGADPRVLEYAEKIREGTRWGEIVHGFLVPNKRRPHPDAWPLLGGRSQLETILSTQPVDRVVFAAGEVPDAQLRKMLQCCERLGIDAIVLPAVMDLQTATVSVEYHNGMPVIAYKTVPPQTVQLFIKRVLDLTASFILLLLLAPLFAVVALLIRIDSPGPILFRQRRVGLHGRVFHCLKFRTMYADAEERLEQLRALNEMDGPVFKMREDPRITRVGKRLRKYSIDELPQLINVLIGEMSLVGPRPPVESEVQQYEPWQQRRLSMKPGITCIWQVSGRNDINFADWMKLDLDYIDRWNIGLDFILLLRTVPAVFRGSGM